MTPPVPPHGGGFGDPGARRHRLHDIQDVVKSLREPVEAPDLTRAILSRVEAEKPFVDERTRRLVWISRLGFAASLAVAALGVALMHRSAPEWLRLAPQPQPLSDVVATAGDEVTTGIRAFRATLTSAASAPAARPVINLAPAEETVPAALAPMPPAYSGSFVALSQRPAAPWGTTQTAAWEAPGQVQAVRRVPLAMTPTPRIVVDTVGVPAAEMPGIGLGVGGGVWGAGLSTAPLTRGTVILIQPAAPAGSAALPAAPTWVRDRAVLDRLAPGGGFDAAEPAVPR